MKTSLLIATLAVTFATASAQASVLLELAGGYLKNSAGEKIADGSGLLVLVASTSDDAFTPPTTDTIFSAGKAVTATSDDVILLVTAISGDGNANGTADAGEFRKAANIIIGAEVPSGSPLQFYWFPTLDTTSTTTAAGTVYGKYRADVAEGEIDADGSDAWLLPADGTTGQSLLFLTSDANSAIHSGTTGTAYGLPTAAVAQGDGTTPPDITVTTSVDSESTVTEPAPETNVTGSNTTSTAFTVFTKKLEALKKQLAKVKKIKNPERRRKAVAAVQAKIKALIKAYRAANQS